MTAKKYSVVVIVLSGALLTVAASFWQTKRSDNELGTLSQKALTGPAGKFGPVIETVLPAAKPSGATDILNLETSRTQTEPPFDLSSRADAIMARIRSNGLDISCAVWPGGATCVTYNMTIVAVDGKCWEQVAEAELFENPVLASRRHAPRRLLVLGHDHPDTYMFRTGEGIFGILRIAGLNQHGAGVNICYRLINPATSTSVPAVIASNISEL